jgi:hypothetical protein
MRRSVKTTNQIRNPAGTALAWTVVEICLGVTLFLSALRCQGQGTLTITFDSPPLPSPGNGLTSDTYLESGMEFKGIGLDGGILRITSGYWAWPDNGSTYLARSPIRFALISDELFNLHSMELAESSVTVGQVPVQFIGYRHDGSIVTNIFTTDGIMDGTNPLSDFETFHFGAEFSDLLRVEIPTTFSWALDNLVFSVVPEPSTLALVCSGLVLWTLRGPRKRV